MAKLDIPNEYPVELTPPDISIYGAGNTGIPHIWNFDSGVPGPHAMITAIVHGNEPCGAIALDWLLSSEFRPSAGRVSFGFMNVAAYEAFDPSNPNATRWIDEDLNRVWAIDVLEGERDSVELRRAREVRPYLDTVDYLFDIHSMQHMAPPLMMCGRLEKGRALAEKVGTPERVVADEGHAAGRRMRDYAQFDDPTSPAAALLIECGQHWQASAGPLAKFSAARFLQSAGVAEAELSEGLGDLPEAQHFFTVTQAVTIESDGFTFAQKFTGGEIIAEKGVLIGHDGERPITTPYPDCMLVMPSKRLWKGQTAVRLAQRQVRD